MSCLAVTCAVVSSPRSTSSALNSADYRVRFPVIGPSFSGRTELPIYPKLGDHLLPQKVLRPIGMSLPTWLEPHPQIDENPSCFRQLGEGFIASIYINKFIYLCAIDT